MSSPSRTSVADEDDKSIPKVPTLSLWDLFNPQNPWVLVPNGSIMGYFDNVRQFHYSKPHFVFTDNIMEHSHDKFLVRVDHTIFGCCGKWLDTETISSGTLVASCATHDHCAVRTLCLHTALSAALDVSTRSKDAFSRGLFSDVVL
jgi:hypothetical protein